MIIQRLDNVGAAIRLVMNEDDEVNRRKVELSSRITSVSSSESSLKSLPSAQQENSTDDYLLDVFDGDSDDNDDNGSYKRSSRSRKMLSYQDYENREEEDDDDFYSIRMSMCGWNNNDTSISRSSSSTGVSSLYNGATANNSIIFSSPSMTPYYTHSSNSTGNIGSTTRESSLKRTGTMPRNSKVFGRSLVRTTSSITMQTVSDAELSSFSFINHTIPIIPAASRSSQRPSSTMTAMAVTTPELISSSSSASSSSSTGKFSNNSSANSSPLSSTISTFNSVDPSLIVSDYAKTPQYQISALTNVAGLHGMPGLSAHCHSTESVVDAGGFSVSRQSTMYATSTAGSVSMDNDCSSFHTASESMTEDFSDSSSLPASPPRQAESGGVLSSSLETASVPLPLTAVDLPHAPFSNAQMRLSAAPSAKRNSHMPSLATLVADHPSCNSGVPSPRNTPPPASLPLPWNLHLPSFLHKRSSSSTSSTLSEHLSSDKTYHVSSLILPPSPDSTHLDAKNVAARSPLSSLLTTTSRASAAFADADISSYIFPPPSTGDRLAPVPDTETAPAAGASHTPTTTRRRRAHANTRSVSSIASFPYSSHSSVDPSEYKYTHSPSGSNDYSMKTPTLSNFTIGTLSSPSTTRRRSDRKPHNRHSLSGLSALSSSPGSSPLELQTDQFPSPTPRSAFRNSIRRNSISMSLDLQGSSLASRSLYNLQTATPTVTDLTSSNKSNHTIQPTTPITSASAAVRHLKAISKSILHKYSGGSMPSGSSRDKGLEASVPYSTIAESGDLPTTVKPPPSSRSTRDLNVLLGLGLNLDSRPGTSGTQVSTDGSVYSAYPSTRMSLDQPPSNYHNNTNHIIYSSSASVIRSPTNSVFPTATTTNTGDIVLPLASSSTMKEDSIRRAFKSPITKFFKRRTTASSENAQQPAQPEARGQKHLSKHASMSALVQHRQSGSGSSADQSRKPSQIRKPVHKNSLPSIPLSSVRGEDINVNWEEDPLLEQYFPAPEEDDTTKTKPSIPGKRGDRRRGIEEHRRRLVKQEEDEKAEKQRTRQQWIKQKTSGKPDDADKDRADKLYVEKRELESQVRDLKKEIAGLQKAIEKEMQLEEDEERRRKQNGFKRSTDLSLQHSPTPSNSSESNLSSTSSSTSSGTGITSMSGASNSTHSLFRLAKASKTLFPQQLSGGSDSRARSSSVSLSHIRRQALEHTLTEKLADFELAQKKSHEVGILLSRAYKRRRNTGSSGAEFWIHSISA